MEAAGFAFSVAQTLLAALSYPPLQQMFNKSGYQSELDSLTSTVSTVSAVLLDAQSVNEEKLSNSERDLIEKLKEAVYDADDLLDEFATLAKQQHQLCTEANEKSLKKVQHLFSSFKVKLKVASSMSREIKNIRKKLDQIVDDAKFRIIKVEPQPIRKREDTLAYVNENRIVGRDIDKERIVNMLLDPNIQGDVPVLAIVGMGGLGKTALAQLVYSDERIQTQFHNRTYWVCVSDEDQRQFNIQAIFARIYKAATDESNIGDLDMNSLVRRLRDLLNQNKYLLVLDDVWTEDHIECNKLLDILTGSRRVAKRGSKIVVTTRSKKTAAVMGCDHPYELQGLSDENSWLLFKITSGLEQENSHDELVKMGEDIVKKCANVPLAITVVGSFLYGQSEDTWRRIQQHGLSATPKDGNTIVQILKFSYDQLSPSLKSCFIYCAMFPKDFGIQKEKLIGLWMAHGYVEPLDEGQSIEEAAEEYFQILVQRCFFQDFEMSENGEIWRFKIHDLMHDMAQQASGRDIFIADSATMDLDKKTYHVYDSAPYNRPTGFITATTAKIRSYAQDCDRFVNVPFPVGALLANWRSLRALDLSWLNITDLPNAIGELLHLRWLNLSCNQELKMLPKSLTKLINLQFLDLNWCYKLEELPKDFNKLVNLRTLFIFCAGGIGEASSDEGYRDGLRYMPLGMEKMACLTRLNKFVLGQRKSSMGQEVRLEDLRLPRNLRGSLEIYISPNYKHSTDYGGGGGYLSNTKYLKSVSMEWPQKAYEKKRMGNDDDDDDVLEDLQPHNNLKELAIKHYPRLTIPQWAREDGLATSLPNLVKIVLVTCNGWKDLPWLGKLQHLKTLELHRLENLECMENKTRGTNIGRSGDGAATAIAESSIFFPSLENLKLIYLPKLQGWWRGSSEPVGGQQLPLFPRLSRVTIEDCPNLRSIPLGPAVETLLFWKSGIVEEEEDQKIVGGTSSSHSGNSASDDPKIKEIETTNVRFLNSLPMVAFQGLTKMTIHWDDKVESLSEVEEVLRGCSSSLRFLKVLGCKNLRSVSRGLEHLAALESLELYHLPELRFEETLGEGEEEEEDDATGKGMPWRCLAQCLRSLELHSLPKVVELPKGMRYLTALQSFEILDLPLIDVPEWIACLSSLHSLEINKCKHLKSLPGALGKLNSLITDVILTHAHSQ